MKYKILKGILIAGVVLGFGSGFAQLGARWAMHRDGRGHCSESCPEAGQWRSKWARQHQRETTPPVAAKTTPPVAAKTTPPVAAKTTPPAAAQPTTP
jgi:hypothetical protein